MLVILIEQLLLTATYKTQIKKKRFIPATFGPNWNWVFIWRNLGLKQCLPRSKQDGGDIKVAHFNPDLGVELSFKEETPGVLVTNDERMNSSLTPAEMCYLTVIYLKLWLIK